MSRTDEELNLSIHGNRFILHIAYMFLAQGKSRVTEVDANDISNAFSNVFSTTLQIIKDHFRKEILYVFFKNTGKVNALSSQVNLKLGLSFDLFNQPKSKHR